MRSNPSRSRANGAVSRANTGELLPTVLSLTIFLETSGVARTLASNLMSRANSILLPLAPHRGSIHEPSSLPILTYSRNSRSPSSFGPADTTAHGDAAAVLVATTRVVVVVVVVAAAAALSPLSSVFPVRTELSALLSFLCCVSCSISDLNCSAFALRASASALRVSASLCCCGSASSNWVAFSRRMLFGLLRCPRRLHSWKLSHLFITDREYRANETVVLVLLVVAVNASKGTKMDKNTIDSTIIGKIMVPAAIVAKKGLHFGRTIIVS
mmetsp:Transcript_22042/g.47935  ORF Transcript_22042/g.47935 Transcript_22042/m.47935 type:complete len:270 (+) Transcript_22042:356-1165(+)